MITRKNAAELAIMRDAGRLLAQILGELSALVTVGQTTMAFEGRAQKLLKEAGVTSPFQGHEGYPYATCISVNAEVVHGMPGERVLGAGDLVGIDLGVAKDGLMVDGAVTVAVAPVGEADTRLLRVAEEALVVGIEQVRAGGRVGDISAAVQRHVEAAGFSVVRALTGHGIGRSLHEEPSVPNFGRAGTGPELEEGMTICIEPMITAGGSEVVIRPGTWPVVTLDGSRAAHVEHTVAVTKDGPVILTEA